MVSVGWRSTPTDAEDRRRRQEYRRERDTAATAFFHPPADACPWCGSPEVRFLLEVVDTRQCKPGTFAMHRCTPCGHVFQNPRLTAAGLAHYYRDSYDGLGHAHYVAMAERSGGAHRDRVGLLADRPAPRTWLDVGARHGHFCREARRALPDTVFWALDPSAEVLAAVDRGWVDSASHTPLVEFAEQHRGVFDAVSAIHYLERTATPQREVQALRAVLRTGGTALIELVNPQSRFARLHGRYWYCWMAPQNLHLMPWRNVRALLEDHGFAVARVQLGRANKPFDNTGALLTALNRHLPPVRSWPWLDRPVGLPARVLRKVVMGLAAPAVALALAVDVLVHAVVSRGRGGNTYRIVAVAR
jgi:SAM-dependent methyltransferase